MDDQTKPFRKNELTITQEAIDTLIQQAGDKLRLGHFQAQEAVCNLLQSGREFSEAKRKWVELHGTTHKWREHIAEQLPDISPQDISKAIACHNNPALAALADKSVGRPTLFTPEILRVLGPAPPEVAQHVIEQAEAGTPLTKREIQELKRQAKAEAEAEARAKVDREKQAEITYIESELTDTKSLLSEVQAELREYQGTMGARSELSRALKKEQDQHNTRLEQDTRKHEKRVLELTEKADRLQRVITQSEQALARLRSDLDEAGNIKRDIVNIREALKQVSLAMASQFAELQDVLQDDQPPQLQEDWNKFVDRLESMVGAVRSQVDEHYPKLRIIERD